MHHDIDSVSVIRAQGFPEQPEHGDPASMHPFSSFKEGVLILIMEVTCA